MIMDKLCQVEILPSPPAEIPSRTLLEYRFMDFARTERRRTPCRSSHFVTGLYL
jgi:hypothetical protein